VSCSVGGGVWDTTGCSVTQTGATGVLTVTYVDPGGQFEIPPGVGVSMSYAQLNMIGTNPGYVTITDGPVITASSPPPGYYDGFSADVLRPLPGTLVTHNSNTLVWGAIWDGFPPTTVTIPLQSFTMYMTFTVSATP